MRYIYTYVLVVAFLEVLVVLVVLVVFLVDFAELADEEDPSTLPLRGANPTRLLSASKMDT